MSNAMSIAVLTVSDSRTVATDTSGQFLVDSLAEAGHHLGARELVEDNIYKIRAVVSNWIADEQIEVVLITGGTGFTQRDTTPEAIVPLLHQEIAGYGELFRALSYKEIGASTVQSRAVGLTTMAETVVTHGLATAQARRLVAVVVVSTETTARLETTMPAQTTKPAMAAMASQTISKPAPTSTTAVVAVADSLGRMISTDTPPRAPRRQAAVVAVEPARWYTRTPVET